MRGRANKQFKHERTQNIQAKLSSLQCILVNFQLIM